MRMKGKTRSNRVRLQALLTHLHEGENQHEDEVADPVECQRQTHGSGTGLLAENLTHHDEGDGA